MHVNSTDVLESENISTVGKIFLAGIATALIGKQSNIKVRGTQDEVEVLKCALDAFNAFQEELHNETSTVQTIMQKLNIAKSCAADFESKFKLPWPL